MKFTDYAGLEARLPDVPSQRALGMGTFASRSYVYGEPVMRLECGSPINGQILPWDDCESLHENRVTAVAPSWYFYPSPDHPFWYLNHSCDANIAYSDWACPDENFGITLFCVRNIRAGEQLCIDYSPMTAINDVDEEGRPWQMACVCGADACRGTIRRFVDLPRSLRERIISNPESGFRTVPAFILNECPESVEDLKRNAPQLFDGFAHALKRQLFFAETLGTRPA